MKAMNSSENSLTTSWKPKMDELSEEKPMCRGPIYLKGLKVHMRSHCPVRNGEFFHAKKQRMELAFCTGTSVLEAS